MNAIGVIVGREQITAARVADGKIVLKSSVETPVDRPQHEVLKVLYETVEEVYDSGISSIGIGVPGLVDLSGHSEVEIPDFPGWDNVPLMDLVAEYFNKPVAVNHLSNCFALGEKMYGKGKEYDNFAAIWLDHQVSAGLIINHQLYSGSMATAGAVGQLIYRDRIVDDFISQQYFTDKNLDFQLVVKRASLGDPVALRLIEEYGMHLAKTIANLLYILAPEAIILGGPLSSARRYFQDVINDFLDENFTYRRMLNRLIMDISEEEDMPLIGASCLGK